MTDERITDEMVETTGRAGCALLGLDWDALDATDRAEAEAYHRVVLEAVLPPLLERVDAAEAPRVEWERDVLKRFLTNVPANEEAGRFIPDFLAALTDSMLAARAALTEGTENRDDVVRAVIPEDGMFPNGKPTRGTESAVTIRGTHGHWTATCEIHGVVASGPTRAIIEAVAGVHDRCAEGTDGA